MNTAFFIVMSAQQFKGYARETDRTFFSVPVQVIPWHCDIRTRMMYCKSPLQDDCVYPVDANSLKRGFSLNNRQRAAARRIA